MGGNPFAKGHEECPSPFHTQNILKEAGDCLPRETSRLLPAKDEGDLHPEVQVRSRIAAPPRFVDL